MCFFVCREGGLAVCQTAVRYAHRTTFSVLTLGQFAQVQPCAIKRIAPQTTKSVSQDVFFCLPRGWIGGFSNRRALCAPNHLSVLTLGQFAQVQPCAIKRIHPNNKERIARCVFFFVERGGLGCFQTATRFACRTAFLC
jgi:hypothetical protein